MSDRQTLGIRQTAAIADLRKQGYRIVRQYEAGNYGEKCTYVVMER